LQPYYLHQYTQNQTQLVSSQNKVTLVSVQGEKASASGHHYPRSRLLLASLARSRHAAQEEAQVDARSLGYRSDYYHYHYQYQYC